MNGVAEVGVQGLHVPTVPRHFNGMADGALYAAGCGLIFFGNGRVKNFGDGVDNLAVVDGQQNGGAQILVALDMRRNTDLMDDLGDLCFNVRLRSCGGGIRRGVFRMAGVLGVLALQQPLHMAAKALNIKGFHQAKIRPRRAGLCNHGLTGNRQQHEKYRHFRACGGLFAILPQDADSVESRQHHIDQRRVVAVAAELLQGFLPVDGFIQKAIAVAVQSFAQQLPFAGLFVYNQNFDVVFHFSYFPPLIRRFNFDTNRIP